VKVVLREYVEGLGGPGDLKEVADGYGRNYLIRRGLAQLATPDMMKLVKDKKISETQKMTRLERENAALAAKISKVRLTFTAKVGEQNRLFGSVTNNDIAEKLSQALNQEIDKRKIELPEPIRHLGEYQIKIHVAHDVIPEVAITVEKET
jgi:large subunit ribosomal protein L9